MDTPKISVIMPVLNNEEYLADAINSILCQTESSFEFIIISEFGNSEKSINILKSYAMKDTRIRLIQNKTKLNISASLNLGMDMARGEYIARMDADDISLPQRFKAQAKFLDTHPEISICASAIDTINAEGHKLNRLDTNPNEPDQIYSDLLFYCCIQHPTVMMRRHALLTMDLKYNPDYSESEDFEFWNRAGRSIKLSRLPNVLLSYRLHKDNASRTRKEQGIENFLTVMRESFLRFDMHFSDEELRILCPITCEMNIQNCLNYCRFIHSATDEMLKKNKKLKLYNQDNLIKTLRKRMFWSKAPWRLVIGASARSIGRILSQSSKTSYALYRMAYCVETYGVRGLSKVIIEYIKEHK